MIIDKSAIWAMLKTTSYKNLIGVGMELKPYELALHMVEALNNSDDYGYVVMGVSKLIDCYSIEGIGSSISDSIKEPIQTALKLISLDIEIKSEKIKIDDKNIFVIMLKNSDKSLSVEFIKDYNSSDAFLKNTIRACLNLQARRHYFDSTEDEKNDYIGDILWAIGYDVKDQTRRGSSSTGKNSGEVDIFVSKDRLPFTIIEAMELNSVNTSYISAHLDKIFSYDSSGNKFNICISYVKVADFESFWEKYSSYVSGYDYPIPLLSSDMKIDDEFRYSELRVMKTIHNRSGRAIDLYHICVRIPNLEINLCN